MQCDQMYTSYQSSTAFAFRVWEPIPCPRPSTNNTWESRLATISVWLQSPLSSQIHYWDQGRDPEISPELEMDCCPWLSQCACRVGCGPPSCTDSVKKLFLRLLWLLLASWPFRMLILLLWAYVYSVLSKTVVFLAAYSPTFFFLGPMYHTT